VVDFAWIWICIRFCEKVLTDMELSPFSSPSVIFFEESHHLFKNEVKVSLFDFLPWFHHVSLDFAMVIHGFSPLVCTDFRSKNLS
jgi:hypothetical protein